METFDKELVRKLIERTKQKIATEKDAKIKELQEQLDELRVERMLNDDFSNKEVKKEVSNDDVDKILGGLND